MMNIKRRELKFIHITKTAGTSIENIAFEHQILWGRHDKVYLNQFKRLKFEEASVWHIPTKYFEKNPYQNYDLFTVVRHPFDRAISEFYCPWTGYDGSYYSRKKLNT